jgi:hypothetical protein
MSAFKPQQRRILIDGRSFHFVAYEGQSENLSRNRPAVPAMWCLMVEGRRCPVVPFVSNQALEAVDRLLVRWVRANALPAL